MEEKQIDFEQLLKAIQRLSGEEKSVIKASLDINVEKGDEERRRQLQEIIMRAPVYTGFQVKIKKICTLSLL